MLRVFIVDDDPLAVGALQIALSPHYQVTGFTDPDAALRAASDESPEIAILDLNFPEHNGLTLLRRWKQTFPQTEIISCSGEISIQRALECLRQGASDYLTKPFRSEDLFHVIDRTLKKRALPRGSKDSDQRPQGFIGESRAIQEVLQKVKLLKNQTHLNVLILGESGTGKELIAKLLHTQESPTEDSMKGGVAERPLIIANMAAIPSNLLESEFFGVERGAFTDAKISRSGKFELAHGGDIFLDEIGDLPLDTQGKILRVLQEKQIQRLGSSETKRVKFRTIAATNRPLADLVAQGLFREDLMYRLTDMVLWLPALRDRPEDIPLLTEFFIRKYGGGRNCPVSDTAMRHLCQYHWPGNVRQLESTIKRALIFARGNQLTEIEIFDPTTLTPHRNRGTSSAMGTGRVSAEPRPAESLDRQRLDFEKERIETALQKYRGNRTLAMEELQLSKATFYRKIQQLGIPLD